ncbi:MAG: 3,4-dihydroxy-2-butanone-4-phosphate synthase, partial [Nitrospirae bacterium]
MGKYKFNTIEEAIEDIRQGRMVILVDDEDRENEGDLCMAAEKVTPEAINFMAKYGRGLICLALTPERVEELKLPMMTNENESPHGTAFTVSIEARHGVTTGISAHDRAHTIKVAIDPKTRPEDLVKPGHVFPLKAKPGGVLQRVGHTEGSVDLARLAGLYPAGVICEIMNDDGTMARVPQLMEFAREHGLKIVTIKDLIEYRMRKESLVKRIAEVKMPTHYGGEFRAIAYENMVDDQVHIALVKGEIKPDEPVLVRVHSECLTGDVFGSMRCDCGQQLHRAM